jgi:hypothetical protein
VSLYLVHTRSTGWHRRCATRHFRVRAEAFERATTRPAAVVDIAIPPPPPVYDFDEIYQRNIAAMNDEEEENNIIYNDDPYNAYPIQG